MFKFWKSLTNLIEVDFLDVTFNLTTGTFWLYKKVNNNLSYINASSNHPPSILKSFFEFNKQFTVKKLFHKEIFDNTKEGYQKVLNNQTFIQRK